MNGTGIDITPFWIGAAAAVALGTGVIALVMGSRLARNADWIVGLGLLSMLATSVIGLANFIERPAKPLFWARDWIWSDASVGALHVGFVQDALGYAITLLGTVGAAIFVVNASGFGIEKRLERWYGAAGLASAGAALSWLSGTVWIGFVGVAISVFAGFFALGTRWDTVEDAGLASRWVRERFWGVGLAVLGALMLASAGTALGFDPAQAPWPVRPSTLPGAALLAIGLFAQMQPFPISRWTGLSSHTPMAARVFFAQALPALAVSALLYRLEPQFRAIGLFPDFGWFAVFSAVLTALCGLFHPNWEGTLGYWISTSCSAGVAALAFSGPQAGLPLLIATVICGTTIALLGSALEAKPNPEAPSFPDRKAWARPAIFLAAALGTGVVGSVATGGLVRLAADTLNSPAYLVAAILAWFGASLLGWKAAWAAAAIVPAGRVQARMTLLPLLFALLALGILWTGTLSGGALGGADAVTANTLSDAILGTKPVPDADLITYLGIVGGAIGLAFVVGYSTSAKSPSSWDRARASSTGFVRVMDSAFGIEVAAGALIAGIQWSGARLFQLVDRASWGGWIPRSGAKTVSVLGRAASRMDETIASGLSSATRHTVEVPGKLLQVIQNGNLQWYLVFALGSGIAILIHFLRFS